MKLQDSYFKPPTLTERNGAADKSASLSTRPWPAAIDCAPHMRLSLLIVCLQTIILPSHLVGAAALPAADPSGEARCTIGGAAPELNGDAAWKRGLAPEVAPCHTYKHREDKVNA